MNIVGSGLLQDFWILGKCKNKSHRNHDPNIFYWIIQVGREESKRTPFLSSSRSAWHEAVGRLSLGLKSDSQASALFKCLSAMGAGQDTQLLSSKVSHWLKTYTWQGFHFLAKTVVLFPYRLFSIPPQTAPNSQSGTKWQSPKTALIKTLKSNLLSEWISLKTWSIPGKCSFSEWEF